MLCTYCMRLFSMISWLLIGCFDLAPGCAMITYPVGFYVFFASAPTFLSFSATARVTSSFSALSARHMYLSA